MNMNHHKYLHISKKLRKKMIIISLLVHICMLGAADCASRAGSIQYSLNSKESSYGQSVAIKNLFCCSWFT